MVLEKELSTRFCMPSNTLASLRNTLLSSKWKNDVKEMQKIIYPNDVRSVSDSTIYQNYQNKRVLFKKNEFHIINSPVVMIMNVNYKESEEISLKTFNNIYESKPIAHIQRFYVMFEKFRISIDVVYTVCLSNSGMAQIFRKTNKIFDMWNRDIFSVYIHFESENDLLENFLYDLQTNELSRQLLNIISITTTNGLSDELIQLTNIEFKRNFNYGKWINETTVDIGNSFVNIKYISNKLDGVRANFIIYDKYFIVPKWNIHIELGKYKLHSIIVIIIINIVIYNLDYIFGQIVAGHVELLPKENIFVIIDIHLVQENFHLFSMCVKQQQQQQQQPYDNVSDDNLVEEDKEDEEEEEATECGIEEDDTLSLTAVEEINNYCSSKSSHSYLMFSNNDDKTNITHIQAITILINPVFCKIFLTGKYKIMVQKFFPLPLEDGIDNVPHINDEISIDRIEGYLLFSEKIIFKQKKTTLDLYLNINMLHNRMHNLILKNFHIEYRTNIIKNEYFLNKNGKLHVDDINGFISLPISDIAMTRYIWNVDVVFEYYLKEFMQSYLESLYFSGGERFAHFFPSWNLQINQYIFSCGNLYKEITEGVDFKQFINDTCNIIYKNSNQFCIKFLYLIEFNLDMFKKKIIYKKIRNDKSMANSTFIFKRMINK
ncbi:LEF4-like protein [Glossina pallidipes salivary gland hypertrophy virus]|uniref:LEF4-like protein n=1 Tax=Glossina hytrovirus (isolate Glossina pallidipes/Ethiopia/Seibersdorf/-) TaxID=379529 RepID=A0A125QZQ3_GHVS|nr:LEF4-like protein [Glossina pallidipes salivary gland hypertrophy virus]